MTIIKRTAYQINHSSYFEKTRTVVWGAGQVNRPTPVVPTPPGRSFQTWINLVAEVNALPVNGFIEPDKPNRRIGFTGMFRNEPYQEVIPTEILNVQPLTLTSLTRLPIPVTKITVSLEALKTDQTYQTILDTIGAIKTLGETSITISEFDSNIVFPKNKDGLRFKVETDAQTVLSMDVILTN